jgi:hypothetical protein
LTVDVKLVAGHLPITQGSEAASSYEEDNEAGIEQGAEDAGEDEEDDQDHLHPGLQLRAI